MARRSRRGCLPDRAMRMAGLRDKGYRQSSVEARVNGWILGFWCAVVVLNGCDGGFYLDAPPFQGVKTIGYVVHSEDAVLGVRIVPAEGRG